MRQTVLAFTVIAICAGALVAAEPAPAPTGPAAAVPGDLTLEPPTIHCLGVQWLVKGDANGNAAVSLAYRKAGDDAWRDALPLLRVNPEALVRPLPEETSLFAGSVLELDGETDYELRVTLSDPDGGGGERILKCRTLGEPKAPAPLRTLYVAPGASGGTGTEDDPFTGLAAADAASKPGDLIVVAKGQYAPFKITKSGTPEAPIVWSAEEGAVISGPADKPREVSRGIDVTDVHDVWLTGFAVTNVEWAVVANGSSRIVMTRCHLYGVDYGFAGMGRSAKMSGFYLADNVLEGPCTWPRTKGIEDPRGFQVAGAGHIVCYNRVIGFADGIDTYGEHDTAADDYCGAVDVYGNDVSEMTDDGIETDYSQQNCRFFRNRLTNCFQGISHQPDRGGPVYVFRNAMYNIEVEPFKMHTAGEPLTSGFYLFHNTCVKKGLPWMVWTTNRVDNVTTRNNLFIGSPETGPDARRRAMDFTPPMTACDFDYDGFGGGPFEIFAKWNNVAYTSLEDMAKRAPVERHATIVDGAPVFASSIGAPVDVKAAAPVAKNDLRLAEKSKAVDAGAPVANINDGFRGKAPDLGAYELGDPLPHYGPRPK